MLKLHVPGFGDLELSHLVLDFNGTLAANGLLLADIAPLINHLASTLEIHVISGDSFGTAKDQLKNINCKVTILPRENQGIAKSNYIKILDANKVIAIGNGRNDKLLLQEARIGIAVLGGEGTATETILAADIIMPDIYSALNLLQNSKQLTATLRG